MLEELQRLAAVGLVVLLFILAFAFMLGQRRAAGWVLRTLFAPVSCCAAAALRAFAVVLLIVVIGVLLWTSFLPGKPPAPTAAPSVTLSASPASPQSAGSTVLLRAALAGNERAAEYLFKIQPPGGDWQHLCEFTAEPSCRWSPQRPGAYRLKAVARVPVANLTTGSAILEYTIESGEPPAAAYDGFQFPLKLAKVPPAYPSREFSQYFGDYWEKDGRVNRGRLGPYSGHLGLDLVTPAADRGVYAAASGWPVRRYWYGRDGNSLWGSHVMLAHDTNGDGRADVYTLYAHLAAEEPFSGLLRSTTVSESSTAASMLRRGDRIGTEGNTGTSSGPHLHFAIMTKPKPGSGYTYVFPNFSSSPRAVTQYPCDDMLYYNPLTFITTHRCPQDVWR